MKSKLRVGILFGGKSAEHEVSLQSARNVYEAIDKTQYEPLLIGIDKNGRWLLNDESRFLLNADDPKNISLNPSSDEVAMIPHSKGAIANFSSPDDNMAVDVIFPILHGPFGEDGTVQGLLKLAEIPFVGSGVLSSAASMDKDVMKRLMRDAALPISKFLVVRSGEKYPSYDEACAVLGSPLFIKPANMGSSVGISKVHSRDEYGAALDFAFEYDTKVIIEEFIPGRELECSVLGSELGEISASVPGEVKPTHEFYSYDAKYIDENGAALIIPADVPAKAAARVRELAILVFKTFCCDGLARVDFFMKDDGTIIVNELNTMPGFTRISMYPKLWEASGISYTKLIDNLIKLSLSRFEKEKKLKTSI